MNSLPVDPVNKTLYQRTRIPGYVPAALAVNALILGLISTMVFFKLNPDIEESLYFYGFAGLVLAVACGVTLLASRFTKIRMRYVQPVAYLLGTLALVGWILIDAWVNMGSIAEMAENEDVFYLVFAILAETLWKEFLVGLLVSIVFPYRRVIRFWDGQT